MATSESTSQSKTKRILPHEWIREYFAPVVGVLASSMAEALCRKNNLTSVELLQPFSKLLTDVTVKDADGVNHSIQGLNVHFQDFNKDPSRSISSKLLYNVVNEVTSEPLLSKIFNGLVLEAPGFTPWFDAYMKFHLQSVPVMEHEFVRHHLGTIFVASSNDKNAVDTLKNLVALQEKQQLEDKAVNYPQYISSGTLKYYLLLHDAYECEEAQAQDSFTQIQQTFGSNSCHLLQINSRIVDQASDEPNQCVSEHWLAVTGLRFCNTQTRMFDQSSSINMTPTILAKEETTATSESDLDHPLASQVVVHPAEDKPALPVLPKLTCATTSNTARHLSPNDLDRIRIFVREFCIRGLIPYAERQMRALNEVITNRKSRSLFSGAKRWFGQSKQGAASGTSVIYSKDAPELQIRKLGDIYFVMKLFKQAYNCFYVAKKDFQSDEAWNYYAGAVEMAALAQFMLADPAKKYPSHYMEDAISKYLQVCLLPEFAIRATLFDALCLKFNGMFQEAANSYIRITNDLKELRSALLLEQVAYCYLLSTPSMVRKYAFYIIMSGFRFSKCGQKKHSSRCYQQGFQVYQGHDWSLSEDHILYTMGHQALLLEDYSQAAHQFNCLLAMNSPGHVLSPLQQMCHLREFFIVHHQREKQAKAIDVITIPKMHYQDLVLDLTGNTEDYNTLVRFVQGNEWHSLERTIREQLLGGEVTGNKTSQPVLGPRSNNLMRPQAIVNEPIRILLPIENYFQTSFSVVDVSLLWKFTPSDSSEEISNHPSCGDLSSCVTSNVVDSVQLEKGSNAVLDLSLVVHSPGYLVILGVAYGLIAQFPQSPTSEHAIRGHQMFSLRGPRLNVSKEHRISASYAMDNRLNIDVTSTLAKLHVDVTFPAVMHQSEVKCVQLQLTNVGQGDLSRVHLVHQHPGVMALSSKSTFWQSGNTDSHLKKSVSTAMALVMSPFPISTISPSQSVSERLWIRAPDQMGQCQMAAFFYYECADDSSPRKKYRLLRKNFTVKIISSVCISSCRMKSCRYDNDCSEAIVINVKNDLFDQVSVSQVCLVSRSSLMKRHLSSLDSTQVLNSECKAFTVQTKSCFAPKSSKDLILSSIVAKSAAGQEPLMQEAPYIDFLKPILTPKGSSDSAFLQDVIVVTWKGPSNISGLLYTRVTDEATTSLDDNEVTDSTSTGVSIDLSESCLASPKAKCNVLVSVAPNFTHDFMTKGPFLVPFHIEVQNSGPDEVVFFYKVDKDSPSLEGITCRYLGCIKNRVALSPESKKLFHFKILVTSPGLYHCRDLRFQCFHQNDEPPDHDELIPLEVAFVVNQESTTSHLTPYQNSSAIFGHQ